MADATESKPDHKLHVRKIRVGLSGGAVHEFHLAITEPVAAVVSLIIDREELDPSRTRVRIISSGKLIRDHSVPLGGILNEGSFLHAAVSEARTSTSEEGDNLERNGSDEEAPLMLSAVDANGEVRIVIPNLTTGSFERLSQAGFSEEEIRMIRRQFRVLRREGRVRMVEDREDDEVTERDSMEEEDGEIDEEAGRIRVRRTDPRLVLVSGAEGTSGDFLLGCIIGYMVGIMVLVFLLDANATRRWRVGLVAGVATNCAFGVLRRSLNGEGQPPFPET